MSDFDFSINDIEAQFMDFMRANNCEPEASFTLQMDGHLHRFRLKGDRYSQKSGAYCVHTDGWPAGWCQNWRNGETVIWKFAVDDEGKNYDYFSSPEFKKALELSRQRQAEIKAEREEKQKDAVSQAMEIYMSLPNADKAEQHPYLLRKQIYSYGLKIDRANNKLAVPLQDIDGNIVNIQWITAEGGKYFLPFAPVSASFFPIALDNIGNREQDKKTPILIGEGIATMSTIYELTSLPCVAAMNCGNIKKVAEAVRKKYPSNPIIIMADNDCKKKVNAGLEAAEAANRELRLDGVVFPDFKDDEDGTDWNDFFVLHGCDEEFCLKAVRAKFNQLPLFNKKLRYKAMAERFGFMDAEYVDTFCKPLPGENFLIEDWIPTQSIMMMFAPSGSGKGFVAVDLAYAIATPEINDWHGKKVLQHGPVVYLAGEGQKGMRKRCCGFKAYKGLKDKSSQLAIIKEAIPINEPNPDLGVNKLIANIGTLYPEPALIIIDTTNRYMFGDENKTPDATSFIQAVTMLMQEFKCSVLIVHHTGLSLETQGRARGSSVFKAAMDMEFRISKSGMFVTLEMTKSKDSDIQRPLVFEMIEVDAPGFFKYNGVQDTTCVLKNNDEIANTISNEKKQEGERMSKSERFARDTYRDAAVEFGKIIQDSNSARTVVGVDVDKWREVFYRSSAADNQSTLRSQFKRARTTLLEDKKILFKQILDGIEYYCLKKNETEYEQTIFSSVSNKRRE